MKPETREQIDGLIDYLVQLEECSCQLTEPNSQAPPGTCVLCCAERIQDLLAAEDREENRQ